VFERIETLSRRRIETRGACVIEKSCRDMSLLVEKMGASESQMKMAVCGAFQGLKALSSFSCEGIKKVNLSLQPKQSWPACLLQLTQKVMRGRKGAMIRLGSQERSTA
jgi:hypothetical protein